MAFNIGSISLGSSAKKNYTHNLGFDNNTTFDFGSVQPLMSQFMLPDSNISVNFKQLVRLAPMPVPSFARVHLQNDFAFVPIADVVPYFEAMLSKQPYYVGNKNYMPTRLPITQNSLLACFVCFLFTDVRVSIYSNDVLVPTDSSDTFQNKLNMYIKSMVKEIGSVTTTLSTSLYPFKLYASSVEKTDTAFGVDASDYVISFVHQDEKVRFCVRLGRRGRILRKVLIGLGYSLDFYDSTPVSLAPCLCFYKAYFDRYAIQRSQNWLASDCFRLIKFIEDNYATSWSWTHLWIVDTLEDSELFSLFLMELSSVFATFDDDYVSVHRNKPALVDGSAHFINSAGSETGISGKDGKQPNLASSTLDNITLQVLQRLTRFVNKDSIIGHKMSDWVRTHFNADIANSLYKDVYRLGSSRLDLQINDVFSTSDTADPSSNTGEYLGAYAGKGIGFAENGFKFHADKHGYVFVFSAIIPTTGYFQGSDPTLYGIDNFTLPLPEYDALGFELTPRGVVSDHNQIFSADFDDFFTNKGFGFVPRFTGYKVKKNIVNGDMSRRSTSDDLSPYHLDRILGSIQLSEDSQHHVTEKTQPLPTADIVWRYVNRFPYLGNYDRIFYNSGSQYQGTVVAPVDSLNLDDNFICQNVFDVKVSNFLKPISMSWDTLDENDSSTVDVKPD